MKFKTEADKNQYVFLELNEDILRKKLLIIKKSKDLEKSRDAKNNWRRNKHLLMKGITKWHNSTDGKRFHRALAKFNALKESSPILYQYYRHNHPHEFIPVTYDTCVNALLVINSIETHMNLELQYYEKDFETLEEYLELVSMLSDDLSKIRPDFLDALFTGKILSTSYQTLSEISQVLQDPKAYLYLKRELSNKSNDKNVEPEILKQITFIENLDWSDVPKCYKLIDDLVDNTQNK